MQGLNHHNKRHTNWPDGQRLFWAFKLAKDVEACADLLAGHTVEQSRLDPKAIIEARIESLIQLRRPIDILEQDAA